MAAGGGVSSCCAPAVTGPPGPMVNSSAIVSIATDWRPKDFILGFILDSPSLKKQRRRLGARARESASRQNDDDAWCRHDLFPFALGASALSLSGTAAR